MIFNVWLINEKQDIKCYTTKAKNGREAKSKAITYCHENDGLDYKYMSCDLNHMPNIIDLA